MNSGKIVADGRDGTGGKFEGSTRGPRGPKKSNRDCGNLQYTENDVFVHSALNTQETNVVPWAFGQTHRE